jgi:hypothetical protein
LFQVPSKAPPTIENLPDEILINIFSHFNMEDISAILARVNWRWRFLASTKSLWPNEIKLSGSDDPLWKSYLVLGGHHFKHVILSSVTSVENVLELIAGTCPNLDTIRLVHCETENPGEIDIEFPLVTAIYIQSVKLVGGLIANVGLPNLTTIDLPDGWDEEDFYMVLAGKSKLTAITCRSPQVWSCHIIQDIVREAGSTLKALRYLWFGLLGRSDNGLLPLLEASNLESLDLSLSGNSFRGSSVDHVLEQKICCQLLRITHKLISFGILSWDIHAMPMAELFASDKLRNLKNLQLSFSMWDEVSDDDLDRITRKLSKLESLRLWSWGPMGTERTFRILSSNCPNLISLEIGSLLLGQVVTGVGLQRLLSANRFWPNLKHLDIVEEGLPGFEKDYHNIQTFEEYHIVIA